MGENERKDRWERATGPPASPKKNFTVSPLHPQMRALFAAIPPSAPPIVTAVLFRGEQQRESAWRRENTHTHTTATTTTTKHAPFSIFHPHPFSDTIRSAPRIVASADPDATGGGSGAVEALAAEATFIKGRLAGLRWADLGCDACGGRGGPRCLSLTPRPPPTPALAPDGGAQPQRSCAVVEADCLAAAAEGADKKGSAEECGGLTLYLASSGDDRDGRPLASGAQVRRLTAPSLTRLFDAIRGTVRSVLAGAGSGFVGDGGGGGGGLPTEGGA